MELKAICDLVVLTDDVPKGTTIREYFKLIAFEVWTEGEGFSGKRPFGNSGWQTDIYATLVKYGVIDGHFDSEGYIEEYDDEAGSDIIEDLIKAL